MRFPNSTRAPVHIPPIIFRNFHKISTPHLLHYPGECGRDGLVVAGAALPVLHSHHPPRRPGRRVQEYVVNVGVEPGSYRVMWPRVLLRCHVSQCHVYCSGVTCRWRRCPACPRWPSCPRSRAPSSSRPRRSWAAPSCSAAAPARSPPSRPPCSPPA